MGIWDSDLTFYFGDHASIRRSSHNGNEREVLEVKRLLDYEEKQLGLSTDRRYKKYWKLRKGMTARHLKTLEKENIAKQALKEG